MLVCICIYGNNLFTNFTNSLLCNRSVYERALDVDHRNITLWLKYAEMEMRNRQVSSCINIYDCNVNLMVCVALF